MSGTASNYEPIDADIRPVAAFTYTPVTGTIPLTVVFADASTPVAPADHPVTSWHWTFGDGSTSTAQNPTHAFASLGTFNVVLWVTNDVGHGKIQHQVVVTPVGTGSIRIDPLQSYIGWAARISDAEITPFSGEWVGIPYDHLHVTCAHPFRVQWTSTVKLYPAGTPVVTDGGAGAQQDPFPSGGIVSNDYPPDEIPPQSYTGYYSSGLEIETPGRVQLASCYPSGLVPWVGINPGSDQAGGFPPILRYGEGPNVIANRNVSSWLENYPIFVGIVPDPWIEVFPINHGYVPAGEYTTQAISPSDPSQPTNYIYLYYDECQFSVVATDLVTGDTDEWTSPTYYTHEQLYWWKGNGQPY